MRKSHPIGTWGSALVLKYSEAPMDYINFYKYDTAEAFAKTIVDSIPLKG
jgi:hypothetical protein